MELNDLYDLVVKKNVPLWTQLLAMRPRDQLDGVLYFSFDWHDMLTQPDGTLSPQAITAAADVAGPVAVADYLNEVGKASESMRLTKCVMEPPASSPRRNERTH
ncbi:hypothetical protein [Nonomuraea sp. NPDC049750]|uniref:hypothetical protein n=1 Tax=Nonomuraea sp. NPDC049750 TaxID=3154738 RepID=UPI0033CBFB16